jgi:hypothetical protein
MESALINFRVTPRERQRLRITLLEEGNTLQEFFAAIVRQKLNDCPYAAVHGDGAEERSLPTAGSPHEK